MEAQAQGKIRFISITNHRLPVAQEAVDSGLYATLQFPFSYLSGVQEEMLIDSCAEAGMGFIAMKGMAGGLLRNGLAAAAFMAQQPNVVPIWGVQYEWELDQFLSCVKQAPEMTQEYADLIAKDRKELSGNFCRSCGYCMPCPQGIEIFNCARMAQLIRRMPSAQYLTPEWQEKMHKTTTCLHCNACVKRCPFGLDTPRLLEENYKDYLTFLK